MYDKVLLIDKPAGLTSFGVVARIRRVLSWERGAKVKVGHAGTLDPFATGLLILLTGKECRNAGTYSKLDKVYETTLVLGSESSTGDPEGEIRVLSHEEPTRKRVEEACATFIGDIVQTPPIYSAIKVGGQRAYKLARAGKSVDMPSRTVHIFSLEIIEYVYPHVRLRAHVSSGTYIRTLAEDIGKVLGTGAYCQELRRTKIGAWPIESSQQLADFGIYD